jgi:hypothetical protein
MGLPLSGKVLIAGASAAATILALRFWDWYLAPRLWVSRLRRLAESTGEPCILDVDKDNVASFRRGGIDLIHKVKQVCAVFGCL